VSWEELGQTRPDLPGHEHFGFKDGVSQPGVRGRVSAKPDVFLTKRKIAQAEVNMQFAAPGQPLVWPGQFVFGYPSTDHVTGDPVEPDKAMPAWLKNGSLIVGRWKSGTPVLRAQANDLPALGASPLANNDFLFTVNSPPPVFLPDVEPPKPFPEAPADPSGLICPHAAHIRKVNPRDQDSDLGDQFDTLTRRVLRRGIPYGPPIHDPTAADGVDRGLHFLCYQTSIVEQFEKLQQDWANNTNAPQAGGHDVIIGQTADQRRIFELFTDGGASSLTLTTPTQWVTPTGGGYFFAPSISTLRDVLGAGS
jgi:Dyp-type peroxidase family